jgi:hypothetical protein
VYKSVDFLVVIKLIIALAVAIIGVLVELIASEDKTDALHEL